MDFLSTLGRVLLTKFDLNFNLNEDEFEEAFKSLKRNKAPGHDGLDTITSVYELI